jgi:hypothetical protein
MVIITQPPAYPSISAHGTGTAIIRRKFRGHLYLEGHKVNGVTAHNLFVVLTTESKVDSEAAEHGGLSPSVASSWPLRDL